MHDTLPNFAPPIILHKLDREAILLRANQNRPVSFVVDVYQHFQQIDAAA